VESNNDCNILCANISASVSNLSMREMIRVPAKLATVEGGGLFVEYIMPEILTFTTVELAQQYIRNSDPPPFLLFCFAFDFVRFL